MEHKFCTGCENHCPLNDLHCRKGRNFFGVKEEGGHFHERGPRNDPRAIALIMRCGKFLRHGMDPGADTRELLRALTPGETAELERLLEKCLTAWQGMGRPEN